MSPSPSRHFTSCAPSVSLVSRASYEAASHGRGRDNLRAKAFSLGERREFRQGARQHRPQAEEPCKVSLMTF